MTNASKTKLQTKAKLALALVLAASIATACTAGERAGNENSPSAVNNGSRANTQDNPNENPSAITEPGSAVPDADTPPEEDQLAPDENHAVLSADGTFNGQIDNHTVELNTDDGPAAFQHGDDLTDALSKLNKDDKVQFTFTEKQVEADGQTIKQLWLVSIEKAS